MVYNHTLSSGERTIKMKNIKKLAAIFLSAALIVCSGCNNEQPAESTSETDVPAQTDESGNIVTDENGDPIPAEPEEEKIWKVGFLYNGKVEDGSTAKVFENARAQIQRTLALDTCYMENVLVSDIPAAVYALEEDGCNIIVSCSPRFATSIEKEAKSAPETYFINFGGTSPAHNLSAFGGELYQTANVCGIVGAFNTKSNVLGIVADPGCYNVYGIIDSYVLGAKEIWGTQTDVRLNWVWSDNTEKIEAAIDDLITQGSDVIMCYTENDYAPEYAASKGVKVIANSCDLPELIPDNYLTGFFFNASTFIIDTVRSIKAETFVSTVHSGGISAGTARFLQVSANCEDGTETIAAKLYDYIKSGQAHVFTGEIKNRDNKVMVKKGQQMQFSGISEIDWLVQGISSVGDFTTVTYEPKPCDLTIKESKWNESADSQ